MPPATLYAWRGKGRLKARALSHNGRKFWLVQADAVERARIKALRQSRSAGTSTRRIITTISM